MWLPLTNVFDEERLHEWLFTRRDQPSRELRTRAYHLGRTLREAELPCLFLTIEQDSIHHFTRRWRLDERDLIQAIHVSRSAVDESRLATVARALLELGAGEFPLDLHVALRAIHGQDIVGQDIGRTGKDEPTEADARLLERAATDTVLFMREEAGVPHLSLWPYELTILVLVRFFALHPAPNSRTCELLSRWAWRNALAGQHSGDIGSKRRALQVLDHDEDRSVQALLRQESRQRVNVSVSDFNLRNAQKKLLLLALLDLGPLNLRSGQLVTIEGSVQPTELLQTLLSDPPQSYAKSLANRMIHPRATHIASALRDVGEASILASHGITRRAHDMLRVGDLAGFLREREGTLSAAAEDFFTRRARWDEPDDPPISALLVDEDD